MYSEFAPKRKISIKNMIYVTSDEYVLKVTM